MKPAPSSGAATQNPGGAGCAPAKCLWRGQRLSTTAALTQSKTNGMVISVSSSHGVNFADISPSRMVRSTSARPSARSRPSDSWEGSTTSVSASLETSVTSPSYEACAEAEVM